MPVALFFWFSPRILCFPRQRREGPGVLSGPLELHSAPPSGKPPSHLAFSFSPSHRGWTSDPDVSGASVGVGRSQSRGEEEGAHQLEETVLAGERVWALECWVGGEAQTPTQKALRLLFKGRVQTPRWGWGRGDRHSLQTPRLRPRPRPHRPASLLGRGFMGTLADTFRLFNSLLLKIRSTPSPLSVSYILSRHLFFFVFFSLSGEKVY